MADSSKTPGGDPEVSLTERDIQFDCGHCGNILVVDLDGAGMELKCPFCGGPVVVPAHSAPHYQHGGQHGGAPQPPPAASPAVEHLPHRPEQRHEETAEAHMEELPPSAQSAHSPAPASESAAPETSREPEPTFDFSSIAGEQLQKRFEELTRHLKENRSQRIELQGYINKATIELHRHQIRMKTLAERHSKFDAEFKALAKHLGVETPQS